MQYCNFRTSYSVSHAELILTLFYSSFKYIDNTVHKCTNFIHTLHYTRKADFQLALNLEKHTIHLRDSHSSKNQSRIFREEKQGLEFAHRFFEPFARLL